MATATTTENTRERRKDKLNVAVQLSQGLLTKPVRCTNPVLEKVAHIVATRAKGALQHLEGDDANTPSSGFIEAWGLFTDARAALTYWRARSQDSEKVIHDLRVFHTHYLAWKYRYHHYKMHRLHRPMPGPASPPEKEDAIGPLASNVEDHLLLGNEWTRTSRDLEGDLYWLRNWEQGEDEPKSKAPPTPELTWLMGILKLFEENDVSNTIEAIRLAVSENRRAFSEMIVRHSELAKMGQGRIAIDEVDKDLRSITVWVPKAYDTTALETAMLSYRSYAVKKYIGRRGSSSHEDQLQ